MKKVVCLVIVFCVVAATSSQASPIRPHQSGSVAVYNSNGVYQKTLGINPLKTDGAFVAPDHVCVDKNGNIYVSDNYAHRIVKLNAQGVFQASYGQPGGVDPGELQYPRGIVCDAQGEYLYVADASNNRIQKLKLADGTWSIVGGGGAVSTPIGIAMSPAGELFVACYGSQKMIKWNGTAWKDFKALLERPRGMAIDKDGNFFVAYGGSRAVGKFAPNGDPVVPPGGAVSLLNVNQIAVDKHGNVYVPTYRDDGNTTGYRVWKLKNDLTQVSNNACNTTMGMAGTSQMRSPMGIAVDSAGNLYVADTGNCRVLKFSPQ
ncbi:MAG TPA: NHL repeat-containing protein [Candidatus Ozemobacteraceae bacterium]|nr:NHL repeat-containing protein [Candidatus Ozemobacteraceae bacterium]